MKKIDVFENSFNLDSLFYKFEHFKINSKMCNIKVLVLSRTRQPLMIREDKQKIEYVTDYGEGITCSFSEWYEINDEQLELRTGAYDFMQYVMMRATFDNKFLIKNQKFIEKIL